MIRSVESTDERLRPGAPTLGGEGSSDQRSLAPERPTRFETPGLFASSRINLQPSPNAPLATGLATQTNPRFPLTRPQPPLNVQPQSVPAQTPSGRVKPAVPYWKPGAAHHVTVKGSHYFYFRADKSISGPLGSTGTYTVVTNTDTKLELDIKVGPTNVPFQYADLLDVRLTIVNRRATISGEVRGKKIIKRSWFAVTGSGTKADPFRTVFTHGDEGTAVEWYAI